MTDLSNEPLADLLPTNLIEDALNERFGERCADFDPGCQGCLAWAELHALKQAAAEPPPQGEPVAVKGLGEWRRGYCDERVTIEQASTGFGSIYQVRALDGVVWMDFPDQRKSEFWSNVAAAKAAAQADYEQRIRSALSPAPSLAVSDVTDAVFYALGEPDYKLARWSQAAEPWHYWSRESITDALTAALSASHE